MHMMNAIDEIRRRMIDSAMAPADLRIALQILREVEAEAERSMTDVHRDGS